MPRILLVGCGKMGAAMLEGWLARGIAPQDIVVVDPGPAAAGQFGDRLIVAADRSGVPSDFQPDILILAVKPQVMDEVARPYADLAKGATVLSVAAGRSIASFARLFGQDAAIIRAMPNTPASVGAGITALCPNANVTERAMNFCAELMSAVGAVEVLSDESLMDAVTAVSGSGPAYVFLLAETLAEAGRKAGLPAGQAARLARATVAGAGKLLAESAEDAASLRQNVTSPKGTTHAALEVLMAEPGMQDLLTRAVEAAAKRSRELAG